MSPDKIEMLVKVKVVTSVVSRAMGMLMAEGIDVKLGEMFIPGADTYLFLGMKNVQYVEGELVIMTTEAVPADPPEGGENGG